MEKLDLYRCQNCNRSFFMIDSREKVAFCPYAGLASHAISIRGEVDLLKTVLLTCEEREMFEKMLGELVVV